MLAGTMKMCLNVKIDIQRDALCLLALYHSAAIPARA